MVHPPILHAAIPVEEVTATPEAPNLSLSSSMMYLRIKDFPVPKEKGERDCIFNGVVGCR